MCSTVVLHGYVRRCFAPVEEKSLLTPWPAEMPEDWVERVNGPENEKQLEDLSRFLPAVYGSTARIALRTGRP